MTVKALRVPAQIRLNGTGNRLCKPGALNVAAAALCLAVAAYHGKSLLATCQHHCTSVLATKLAILFNMNTIMVRRIGPAHA